MYKASATYAMPLTAVFCFLLSACGGGDGGNDMSGAASGSNAYSAGTTIAKDPEAQAEADKPWYMTVDPTRARFNGPEGVELDKAGNLYVVDAKNYTIRKIAKTGVVTTLAGSAGMAGTTDGIGSAARFSSPKGLALDSSGSLYVTDANAVRKITPNGVVTTLAGVPGQYGYRDGSGAAARLGAPNGIAVDKDANVYVAECINTTIRKITPAGVVSTLAGEYEGGFLRRDGVGAQAAFDCPSAMTIDRHGRLFVSDIARRSGILTRGSSFIRRIDTKTARVVTLAGNLGIVSAADPKNERVAQFGGAHGLAVDHDGNIFVTDINVYDHARVQRIATDNKISTLLTYAEKNRFLNDVTVHWQGNLFVSDSSHAIFKITPQLELVTYAGKVGEVGTADTH